MVGGLSRVSQDIPPFALAAGIPIRVFDINRIGLRRRGFDSQTRAKVREMFRLIYNSGYSIKEGIEQLNVSYPGDPEAKLILDFAANNTRGIAPRMTKDWKSKTESEFD